MKIGVTQSVEERIKATPLELVEKAPLVFCWETHLLKVKHRNVLLIMNASSNYTVRRHTVVGANRTIFSYDSPTRSCCAGTNRTFLPAWRHIVVALFERQHCCF